MDRMDLQRLTECRLREAKTLIDAGEAAGAYYLAGYGVECALKACICKKFREHVFPDKGFVNSVYSHKLKELLRLADLELPFQADARNNAVLERYWAHVVNWDENSRYEDRTEEEAKELYLALTDPKNGVLQWLKKFW